MGAVARFEARRARKSAREVEERPRQALGQALKKRTGGTGARHASALAVLTAAGLLLFLSASCASRASRPRAFVAAGEEQAARALAAWREAVARAETLGPARLLYEVKIRQGVASMSGTLALSTAEPVRATITGPFGSTVATYSDGALKGEKFAPVEIESGPLLSLLAGVWKAPRPEVRGIEADDALLVWTGPSRAQGILHLPTARFTSLSVERGGKAYEASYSGPADPWPARVDLKDLGSSSSLRLTLVGREPAP